MIIHLVVPHDSMSIGVDASRGTAKTVVDGCASQWSNFKPTVDLRGQRSDRWNIDRLTISHGRTGVDLGTTATIFESTLMIRTRSEKTWNNLVRAIPLKASKWETHRYSPHSQCYGASWTHCRDSGTVPQSQKVVRCQCRTTVFAVSMRWVGNDGEACLRSKLPVFQHHRTISELLDQAVTALDSCFNREQMAA